MQISPNVLVNKISEIPFKKIKNFTLKKFILNNSTYSHADYSNLSLYNIFALPVPEHFSENSEVIENAIKHIIEHNFDLLGSGITNVSHNSDYKGFNSHKYEVKIDYTDKRDFITKHINQQNQSEANKIIDLLPENYKLIDWQRDFISGFRWREDTLSIALKYGDAPGVDVKIPWELGRLQHLMLFPTAFKLSKANKISIKSDLILAEYQNQILDFIACNPRHFGIQWKSTMDVSIRMLNILISFQIFQSEGVEFDENFKIILLNSVQSHIKHSVENLEWSAGMRGNHYLASICALVVSCIILQNIEENLQYLSMSVSELFNEILHQFNKDGSNFEGSIPYHYFAFEMIAFAFVALNSIPNRHLANIFSQVNNDKLTLKNGAPVISKQIRERIGNIILFSKANLFKSEMMDGDSNDAYSTWNIGDNDSGKFLKLFPKYHYFNSSNDEYSPNYDKSDSYSPHSELLNFLIAQPCEIDDYLLHNYSNLKFDNYMDFVKNNTNQNNFPDFGLYLFEGKNYTAAFKCGKIGQFGKGGHSHNDQLSILLKIHGIDFLIDNGTYTYTADPNERNRFRATAAHNTLSIKGMEQNDWERSDDPNKKSNHDDLFWLKNNKGVGKIQKINQNEVIGYHRGYGAKCIREIKFENTKIIIRDIMENNEEKDVLLCISKKIKILNNNDKIISFILSNSGKDSAAIRISTIENFKILEADTSPAYGKIEKATIIKLTTESKLISYDIEIV